MGNGNGRTARALAYLIFCSEFGGLLPGEPSFSTIVAGRREEYVLALREADAGEAAGREDLTRMARLVGRCIMEQIGPLLRDP